MFRLTSKYPDGTMTHAASIFCDHVGFEPTPQPSRSVVIYYYISDANGTAWGLTDSSGTVVWSADYDSYGNATFFGTIDQPLRMPGQYHDTESGLYYNLARYYEPTTGRYLSVDPLRDAEDYTYAGGNPLKYVDPTGTEFALAMFGVVSGGLSAYITGTKTGLKGKALWDAVKYGALIGGVAGLISLPPGATEAIKGAITAFVATAGGSLIASKFNDGTLCNQELVNSGVSAVFSAFGGAFAGAFNSWLVGLGGSAVASAAVSSTYSAPIDAVLGLIASDLSAKIRVPNSPENWQPPEFIWGSQNDPAFYPVAK